MMSFEEGVNYAIKKLERSNLSEESRAFYELALNEIMFAKDFDNAKAIGYWEGYKDGLENVVKYARHKASECNSMAHLVLNTNKESDNE